MELTLLHSGIEAIGSESAENLSDMGNVLIHVVGVHQDVIYVDNCTDI